MNRRLPALVLVIAAVVTVIVVARSTPGPSAPTFAAVAPGWMPAVPPSSGLTDTWFCPGVPSTGEDGVGGVVDIANVAEAPITAQVQWIGTPTDDPGADLRTEIVTVAANSVVSLDVTQRRRGAFVGAIVEIEGDGGIVEQRADHPAGSAVSPCANATSDRWYLAEGFTVGGSTNRIVLMNPFDDVVIVDVSFATADGARAPAAYQGLPVAPRTIQVLDLGAPGTGAQGEAVLAVSVEATRGQLIVARAQQFLDGGRLGFTLSMAAPALREQWWFADGAKGPGITERFSVYNPGTTEVEVDVIFLGVTELAEVDPIVVPARQVVTFESGQVATLVEGRHATVFSTRSDQGIVVERATTVVRDGRPGTAVLQGAPPSPTGSVATVWYAAIGPSEPTPEALVLYNVDNADGLVTVFSVGPDGPVAIPGLEDRVLPPASLLTLDLVDPASLGRPLIVSSTTRVFVERAAGDRRSASWALPALG